MGYFHQERILFPDLVYVTFSLTLAFNSLSLSWLFLNWPRWYLISIDSEFIQKYDMVTWIHWHEIQALSLLLLTFFFTQGSSVILGYLMPTLCAITSQKRRDNQLFNDTSILLLDSLMWPNDRWTKQYKHCSHVNAIIKWKAYLGFAQDLWRERNTTGTTHI